jgi:hypothetical protein
MVAEVSFLPELPPALIPVGAPASVPPVERPSLERIPPAALWEPVALQLQVSPRLLMAQTISTAEVHRLQVLPRPMVQMISKAVILRLTVSHPPREWLTSEVEDHPQVSLQPHRERRVWAGPVWQLRPT